MPSSPAIATLVCCQRVKIPASWEMGAIIRELRIEEATSAPVDS
jgi:hypothetical protein